MLPKVYWNFNIVVYRMISPIIFGGSGGRHLVVKVARLTGFELGELTVKTFPDGETYVRFLNDVEGKDVIIINSIYHKPNDILMELLLEIETLKDLGAQKVIGVIPYFAYARQDSRFNPGEAVSFEIVTRLLERAGLDEVYTIDLHLHRVEDISKMFKIPAYNLTAVRDLVKFISKHYRLESPIIIGPDEEAEQWAKVAADTLGVEYDVLEKKRISAEEVIIEARTTNVKGRDVIIVDDIISTGGTMVEAIKALKRLGARNIIVACTHAILAGDALYKVLKAGALDVIATDTIPSPISYVSVAPIIAEALKAKINKT